MCVLLNVYPPTFSIPVLKRLLTNVDHDGFRLSLWDGMDYHDKLTYLSLDCVLASIYRTFKRSCSGATSSALSLAMVAHWAGYLDVL